MRRPFLYTIALLFLAARAFAQEPVDPRATARVRLGPLAFTPTISIKDVGLDTNVFNSSENPVQDFTATVSPQVDFWLRVGSARISGRANVGYVFFLNYAGERSFNTQDEFRVEFPRTHIKPFVEASYLNTRERSGLDVDTRARRMERWLTAGVDLLFSPRLTVRPAGRRGHVAYDQDAVSGGVPLRYVFDRDVTNLSVSARYKVTPLATLVVAADAENADFTFSPDRDSRTIRVMPGLELSPFAIVKGSAYVGVRRLDMLASGIPDYLGPVGSAELRYTLRGSTGFSLNVNRDVFYSFEIEQPYYVLTDVTASVTRHVVGPWDVQGRIGHQQLAYRNVDTVPPLAPRTDQVTFYGAGIGYRIGHTARLGVNLDSYHRRSPVPGRACDGLRLLTSITYGQ